MGVLARLKHSWNAFLDQEEDFRPRGMDRGVSYGASYGVRPDRIRLRVSNERSIIASIYTRIAIDAASIAMRHVRLDENGRYLEDVKSGLNTCLTLEANIDQGARMFKQDMALRLLDVGVIAIVPVDRSSGPSEGNVYDILTMRVGEVVHWFPRHVRVELYNDQTGLREQVTLPKKDVGIVENPLYNVMNEMNSTLQRLNRKLSLLDFVDEQSSSGKLDLIIQLPYMIKSDTRREQAEQRRKDIEFQLRGSQYGIAYTDGTEKVIQLNRPAENNLWKQVEALKAELYNELGITAAVMDGTADEKAMLNYYNRTIEPILTSISEELKRKFLTKTARTQGQSVEFFRDPFKLVEMANLAEIADKFTRNEIVSSNEFRQFIGIRPSKDPKADELRNSNMPRPLEEPTYVRGEVVSAEPDFDPFAGINQVLDDTFKELGVPG